VKPPALLPQAALGETNRAATGGRQRWSGVGKPSRVAGVNSWAASPACGCPSHVNFAVVIIRRSRKAWEAADLVLLAQVWPWLFLWLRPCRWPHEASWLAVQLHGSTRLRRKTGKRPRDEGDKSWCGGVLRGMRCCFAQIFEEVGGRRRGSASQLSWLQWLGHCWVFQLGEPFSW
jgi:hypothetical protein